MWNTSYCVGSTSYFRWSTSQCLYNTSYCMWNKQPSFCSSPSAAQSPKRKVAWYKLNFTLCQLRNCLFPWVSFFGQGFHAFVCLIKINVENRKRTEFILLCHVSVCFSFSVPSLHVCVHVLCVPLLSAPLLGH